MVTEWQEDKEQLKKDKLPRKVVVRKLPPTYTEKDFVDAVEPLPENSYFYFVPGDKNLGPYAYSRAYIHFVNHEDVFLFSEQFDGYVFVDQKGNEFPALVEFAPFQKIPKPHKNRKDPRCGTIDEDSDYLAFLETLNEQANSRMPQLEAMLEEIDKEEKDLKANPKVKTPLLEFLEQRAIDKQKMAERRRKKELERRKAREEDRKRRKELAIKKQEAERERQRAKNKEKYSKKEGDSPGDKEEKPGEKVSSKLFTRSKDSTTPVKTKRYSEVRRRGDDKDRKKIDEAIPEEPTLDKGAHNEQSAKKEPVKEHSIKKETATENTANKGSSKETSDKKDEINSEKEETKAATESKCDLTDKEEFSEKREKSDKGDNENSDSNPRPGRRIRNKDRPDMQLYRPGQSRLKTKTSDEESKRDDETSSSPSPSPQLDEEKNKNKEKPAYNKPTPRKGFSYSYDRDNKSRRGRDETYRSKTFRRTYD